MTGRRQTEDGSCRLGGLFGRRGVELDGLVVAGAGLLVELELPFGQVVELDLGASLVGLGISPVGHLDVNLDGLGQSDNLTGKQHKV